MSSLDAMSVALLADLDTLLEGGVAPVAGGGAAPQVGASGAQLQTGVSGDTSGASVALANPVAMSASAPAQLSALALALDAILRGGDETAAAPPGAQAPLLSEAPLLAGLAAMPLAVGSTSVETAEAGAGAAFQSAGDAPAAAGAAAAQSSGDAAGVAAGQSAGDMSATVTQGAANPSGASMTGAAQVIVATNAALAQTVVAEGGSGTANLAAAAVTGASNAQPPLKNFPNPGAAGAATGPHAAAAPAAETSPIHALTEALARAVGDSGLFYESHLADWLAGQRDLADLAREPQAGWSAEASADAASIASNPGAALSPAVLSLVRQQLDLLASGQFQWRGEVWPGMPLDWRIEADPEQHGPDGQQAQPLAWRTRVTLNLRSLGPVEAELRLSGTRLTASMRASESGARRLQAHAGALTHRLAGAGLELTGLSVDGTAPESEPMP